ncbi:E3 ubiquitin-protein ligase TRAIP-like [Microplitis mediator]|uniref:E3 ubiquitin-protein ligase TRAIP-like n=1 Tax=Microplitis mediator TaxID=375433 RepID=UPI002557A117|nr:E3 ubiquitin-protein ligase TRAIP-like [Microplitis mediator]
MDILCAICLLRFQSSDEIKGTKCGHVFHYHCLHNWLKRSKTCPQCREPVSSSRTYSMYFNFSDDESHCEEMEKLQQRLDELKQEIHKFKQEKEKYISSLLKSIENDEKKIDALKWEKFNYRNALKKLQASQDYYKKSEHDIRQKYTKQLDKLEKLQQKSEAKICQLTGQVLLWETKHNLLQIQLSNRKVSQKPSSTKSAYDTSSSANSDGTRVQLKRRLNTNNKENKLPETNQKLPSYRSTSTVKGNTGITKKLKSKNDGAIVDLITPVKETRMRSNRVPERTKRTLRSNQP